MRSTLTDIKDEFYLSLDEHRFDISIDKDNDLIVEFPSNFSCESELFQAIRNVSSSFPVITLSNGKDVSALVDTSGNVNAFRSKLGIRLPNTPFEYKVAEFETSRNLSLKIESSLSDNAVSEMLASVINDHRDEFERTYSKWFSKFEDLESNSPKSSSLSL